VNREWTAENKPVCVGLAGFCPLSLLRIGTRRALSIYGMATPTVSAGYRRRLGRNEPLGAVPNGSFLFFTPSNAASSPLRVSSPVFGSFAGWLFNAHLDRSTVTVCVNRAVSASEREIFLRCFGSLRALKMESRAAQKAARECKSLHFCHITAALANWANARHAAQLH